MQKLASYALIFVLVGMILGFGSLITQETRGSIANTLSCNESPSCNVTTDDCCSEHLAYNATTHTLEGMDTMGSWQPILAIVIVAGIVISLLLGSFIMRPSRA